VGEVHIVLDASHLYIFPPIGCLMKSYLSRSW